MEYAQRVGTTKSLGPPRGPEERAAFSTLIARAVIRSEMVPVASETSPLGDGREDSGKARGALVVCW